jgi:diguanylate cyclase
MRPANTGQDDAGIEMTQDPIYAKARRAIDTMEAQGIPPSSAHYEVWLAYHTGERPEVSVAIDDLLATGQAVDAVASDGLHQRFFSTVRYNAEVILTGARISEGMVNLIQALQDAATGARDYNEVMAKAQVDLAAIGATEPVGAILRGLIDATRSFASRNSELETKVSQTTREIEQLRTSLDKVRLESFTDALTGAANRKFFDETLQLRIAESLSQGTPLCLALCDIDHFKSFNDRWGHQTGDQVIKFTAATLQRFAKGDHLVARYGGEEFAVIMPRTELWEAFNLLEQARFAMETKKLLRRTTREDLGGISASFGVALLQSGDTASTLVERADKCLYASKRDGRNRVTPDRAPRARSAA